MIASVNNVNVFFPLNCQNLSESNPGLHLIQDFGVLWVEKHELAMELVQTGRAFWFQCLVDS
eukprot:Gb_19804 [translate_table: standard]